METRRDWRKRRVPTVPTRARVESRERHDRELRVAKRRVEPLVDRIPLPAPLGTLAAQAKVEGLLELCVLLRPLAREGERVERVKGDEVRLLRLGVETVAPHPAVALQLVEPIHELADLFAVPLAAHRAERDQFPVEIDDRAGGMGGRELFDAVALLAPRRVAGLALQEVEGGIALRCDLERADARRAAV